MLAAFFFSIFMLAAPAADTSPELKLCDRAGNPFSLAQYRGKVVALDFWAPWCAPCRESFPFLDSLRASHGDKGLQVVGLTLDSDQDAIAAFLEAVPVGFPIALDPSEHAGEAFEIVAMPTTLLLDRTGRVAARFEGGGEDVQARITAAVDALLAGETLPPGTDVRVSAGLEASGKVRAWQRGYLADPIMSLDGDALTKITREHVHASKEGAAGDGGPSGGGCGCN